MLKWKDVKETMYCYNYKLVDFRTNEEYVEKNKINCKNYNEYYVVRIIPKVKYNYCDIFDKVEVSPYLRVELSKEQLD